MFVHIGQWSVQVSNVFIVSTCLTSLISKPKTPHNERLCKFCKDQVEEESHFLLKCPKHNLLRQNYAIDHENNEDSLSFIICERKRALYGIKCVLRIF